MRTHSSHLAGFLGIISLALPFAKASAQPVDSTAHAMPAAKADAKILAAAPERDMRALEEQWQRNGVQVGGHIDDLSIYSLEGKGTRLGKLWKDRPVLLITASLTSPIARGSCPHLQSIIDAHGPEVRVVLLYTIEAHPRTDASPYSPGREWVTAENERSNILHRQPKSLEDRLSLANAMNDRLKSVAPMFVDGMDNAAWRSLGGGPNMALLIDAGGVVIAKQAWLDVDAMSKSVDALLKDRTAAASGAYFAGKHARPRMKAFIEALQSNDLSRADSFYARGARMWNSHKSGEGMPAGVDGWREWDTALNAQRTIESATIEANAVIVTAAKVNDFDRLIGFAGERARTTYWFNDAGDIAEVLREPERITPSFQTCFNPALEWAKKNRSEEFRAIFPGNEFARTADAANRWRTLLNDWRAATRRE